MSTGKPPTTGKAFLGDEDMGSELDAWDATFDALHATDEAGAAANAEVMAWPAPALDVISSRAPAPLQDDPVDHTLDEAELDEQMTLDAVVGGGGGDDDDNDDVVIVDDDTGGEPPEERTFDRGEPPRDHGRARQQHATIDPYGGRGPEPDPLETDFSDVGVEGKSSALGDLLGGQDDNGTATRMAPIDLDIDDDDGVFTSASRRAGVDDGRFDDALATPPRPRQMPLASPMRTPAIVRRAPIVDLSRANPTDGQDAMFNDESTRVSSIYEIESHRNDSRPVAIPAVVQDDDYEIEIDQVPAPPMHPVESQNRRTAHVLRRADQQPTKPPPIAAQLEEQARAAAPHDAYPDEPDQVIELNIDDEPVTVGEIRARNAASAPAPQPVIQAPRFSSNEDDFSDVAFAVGADADDALSGPLEIPEPPMFELEFEPPTPTDALDDALSTMLDLGAAGAPALTPTPTPAPAPAPAPAPTASANRPPAIVDLYPRVKTPTSVPPLGLVEKMLTAKTLSGLAPTSAVSAPVQPTELGAAPMAMPPPLPDVEPSPLEAEPALDLDAIGRTWPEELAPLPSVTLDEHSAAALLVYEREIATVDDSASTAALRNEAGRLSERLTDFDRARAHYDAALLADPRATTALRGLRRLARASGDLAEATRHLEAEMAIAGSLERRPLGQYRIDLLMASGEQDLARVAVGEILDSAPSDVRALLAQLELAFLDGRADEFGSALEQLAHAVTDNELRAAVQSARGVLAAHHNDTAAAATWFSAAAESDPASLAARLGAIRQAAGQGDGDSAGRGLVELAYQVAGADPLTAAAAALRAQHWGGGEVAAAGATLALETAPDDPLVARLAAETSLAAFVAASAPPVNEDATPEDRVASLRLLAAAAFAQWARRATAPAERVYAAARAAELDPTSGVALWSTVLSLDPGDDYAAAQLRTAHVAEEATQAAIDVDLGVTADVERDRARLRAAYGLIAIGNLDQAIEILVAGHAARPGALALAEALGEALAAAGKWSERATLFAALAAEPGEQLDGDVAQLRSALAWEEAVGASVQDRPEGEESADDEAARHEQTKRTIGVALEAWERVLEQTPGAPTAHAAALLLANRLGDRDVIADVLARTQAAERSAWGAASLGLRRARLAGDAEGAEQVLRELHQQEEHDERLDDPRRTLALLLSAARRKEFGDAAILLEERATTLEQTAPEGPHSESAALRLRAAQLALDAGDALRATTLLGRVEQALPSLGVVPDLLAAARRRAGDRPTATSARRGTTETSPAASGDAFARIVRDADLAGSLGDGAAALALYQRALELRPGDPLASIPLVRVATQLRQAAPVAALALAQLRDAEASGDNVQKASAYELLARIDIELRDDASSAQISLESASQADPTRIDLMLRLERAYVVGDQLPELLRLRQAELDAIPPELHKDRAALYVDLAGLAARDQRSELEVAELYRAALVADPRTRLALLHLESIVRRAGFSEELAELETKIAAYFSGDARSAAAFATRSGETLAEIGQIDTAVQRFGVAETTLPGHIPALEGWRHAALKGQLWIDVAESATRQANAAALVDDPRARAALHHFAGVALMDKALVGEQAMACFHRAVDADPSHTDAFLRLRILLEEDGNHDELAVLLAKRLEVEPPGTPKSELHRALAELSRNFLSDRESAKIHYRAILVADPNDLRAHAAIADIAWEQGAWQEAADALVARARLERQPEVLKTLCFRLGLIYADYLVDVPLALKAFQRALTYAPEDENTLVRLADLATTAGEWKLALGACERLVKQETDLDRRASHLHRVAKIFKAGFGDSKRAERALNLALDGAPTSDEALQLLVQFYREANDITSVRVHLNRVAGAMRARAAQNPKDGVAYRVISRVMTARAAAGVGGSLPIARAAAELAELLGSSGEPEKQLLAEPPRPEIAPLLKPEADEVLFPRGIQPELRQLFALLGDRVAKHVGVSLQPYGVARGDRLRARDSAIASVAQSVASGLGFGDIDVYVSNKQPWVMVAEPTSPISLVLGSAIGEAGGDSIRFAAGAALKLAQSSLAIPARLAPEELGVLVVALLRLFQPDFPMLSLDADAIAAQVQKLRRLIPNNLLNELKPFAQAIDAQQWSHEQLARDLKITGLRAGLVASASLLTGLQILSAQAGVPVTDFIADPVAQGLITFAIAEDHAVVAR